LELIMNGLVVLAACICASSAQIIARAALPGHQSHQFHAQDEFGQFSFGHAGGPSARTESRDAYGVTRGSYQYLDAFGAIQTVNYVSDALGFRVAGSNLPVGPGATVAETAEVAAARAEFQAAYDAAVAANAAAVEEAAAATEEAAAEEPAAAAAVEAEERKKRSAGNVLLNHAAVLPYGAAALSAFPYGLPAAGLGLLPYPYAAGAAGVLAAAPADIVADVELPAAAVDAAEAPAAAVVPAAYNLPAAAVGAYALPAAVAPVAGREATLTEIKLNPGHAVFYKVD